MYIFNTNKRAKYLSKNVGLKAVAFAFVLFAFGIQGMEESKALTLPYVPGEIWKEIFFKACTTSQLNPIKTYAAISQTNRECYDIVHDVDDKGKRFRKGVKEVWLSRFPTLYPESYEAVNQEIGNCIRFKESQEFKLRQLGIVFEENFFLVNPNHCGLKSPFLGDKEMLYPPLYIAAVNREYKIFKMLLKWGANPNIKLSEVYILNHVCFETLLKDDGDCSIKMCKSLLKAGANPNNETDGDNSLHYLLGKGLSWSKPWGNLRKNTEAAKEVLSLLIEAKADINHRNDKGQTPILAFASHTKNVCAKGGSVSVQDAATVFSALKEAGADLSIKDNEGHSIYSLFDIKITK